VIHFVDYDYFAVAENKKIVSRDDNVVTSE